MAPETVPALRCESRLPRAEPRWGWLAAVAVLLASVVDAMWLVPAQQRAGRAAATSVPHHCPRMTAPAPEPPSPAAGKRVTDIYLLEAPPRR